MNFSRNKHLWVATVAAITLHATSAAAAQFTSGIGVAGRAGFYNGLTSIGGEASLRLETFEVAAGVMNGYEDLHSHVERQTGDPSLLDWSGDNDVSVDSARINQVAKYLQVKLHPMNGSFYFGLGAGQSTTTGRLKVSSYLSDQEIDLKHTATANFGTFSVGNIWTPGGVMIGCEWFGIARSRDVKITTDSNSTDIDEPDMLDAQDTFYDSVRSAASDGQVSGLVLHIGYMIGG